MKPENVKCPRCGGPMVSRANRQTGQRFWGCAEYPQCTGTRNTDGEAPRPRRTHTSEDDYDDPRSGSFGRKDEW